jgi:hypothetical protein
LEFATRIKSNIYCCISIMRSAHLYLFISSFQYVPEKLKSLILKHLHVFRHAYLIDHV